ncbi:hypothetical protein VX159_07445 [Dechloromonas sp. ZY10]|uniref:hypothetical protein n=1 Tax=Dechloromonas aquae TaxID=2664436 RepID=UPI003527A07B
MDNEQVNRLAEVKEAGLSSLSQNTSHKAKDWRERFLEMDLLSPLYVFAFIVLFKDGRDGFDLHDAIIKFILTYNGQ